MNDKEIGQATDLAAKIQAAIGESPAAENVTVVMVALGIVLGAAAKASRQADAVMPLAINTAHRVINGELAD